MAPEGGSKMYDRRTIFARWNIGDNDGRRTCLPFECERPKPILEPPEVGELCGMTPR